MSAPLSAAAAPGAPWPAVTLSASAKPSQAPPGATVTYTDALTNTGDVAGSGIRLTHALPTGFTYVAGSAGIYRDGILIGRDRAHRLRRHADLERADRAAAPR